MAMILDAFVGRSIDKLLEFMAEETSMVLGVKDELKKLQRTMERMRGFLESAERKRHADPNINTWVTELKDIMYDADDIIDLYMLEGSLLEDDTSKSAVCLPLSLFSCFSCVEFRHEIGSKIRELNDRLKQMEEGRSKLPTLEYTEKDVQVRGVNPRQTSPIEVESDIVGTQIEEATQSLVESLIKVDNKNYRILGIVGMGGIGKTTLASHIYNDERIKQNFSIRVWACVSQEFSETELLKEIIRGAGGNYGEAKTKAELGALLSFALSESFLIVLDDVWRTDVWEDLLRSPLKSARASGRIVITTRITNVAIDMTKEIHTVNKMDNDSGWKLLRKKVCRDYDDEDEEEISRLEEIGVQIVEKCDGLPLAIKVIAAVLRSKDRNPIEWNKVLKSDAWSMSQLHQELPGALFLSYENLPSDLKQCFLYCSLFPEDYIMRRDELIRYWVAEGFVKRTQGDIIMEDIAEDCYRELIGRNLLQPYNDDAWGELPGNRCKMHDLLRSLALFLTRDESIFLGGEQSPNINPLTNIRCLSMANIGERVEVPDAIKQQKCLRTLMLRKSWETKMIENELLERLQFLRIIMINVTRIERLPDSIGDLLHLRYIDLDQTSISNLPESIGCLVNLQILNLSSCIRLHSLPKAITKLCNLRCLRLGGTPVSYVPKGIGKLKHLNHLEGFVVGHDDLIGMQDDEGCDLKELQSLSQLRFLEIKNLRSAQPVGAPVLANTHSLRTLILNHYQEVPLPSLTFGPLPSLTFGPPHEDATQRFDEIYAELSPQSIDLQRLEIYFFYGSGFPSWMMSHSLDVSFPNLTFINLSDCKLCLQLPPLGLLPQLKFLTIGRADAIETIGPEFLGPRASAAASTAFPKLEMLLFSLMNNWEKWSFYMMEGVGEERRGAPKLLPRLKKLQLDLCPELRALPEELRHATSLQELRIKNADSLIEIDNLPFLTDKLSIWGSRRLERVSNFPSLKSLSIGICPRLEHVENLDKLQYLDVGTSATTDADGETEHLPQWLLELLQNAPAALQNLKKFDLKCSLPLLKTFLKDGPNWPIIQRIPHVRISEYRRSSYIEYTKDPPAFKTNVVESKESAD